MPRGNDYRIPVGEVFDAGRLHQLGWSLNAISRMRYRQWGYKTPQSAAEGLRRAMRILELPVRSHNEAIALFNTTHGNSSRAAAQPGHPDHDRYLAHRRFLAHRRAIRSGRR